MAASGQLSVPPRLSVTRDSDLTSGGRWAFPSQLELQSEPAYPPGPGKVSLRLVQVTRPKSRATRLGPQAEPRQERLPVAVPVTQAHSGRGTVTALPASLAAA